MRYRKSSRGGDGSWLIEKKRKGKGLNVIWVVQEPEQQVLME